MDLDFLLRLLERRVIAGILAAVAALWAVDRYGAYTRSFFEMKLNPPASAESPYIADILKDVEKREHARVRGLHRAVSAEIEAARRQGLPVHELQNLADDALARDSAAYRSVAIERLNTLRMRIPQKKTFTKTANSEDLNPDLNDAPVPKTKYRARVRKTAR
ncbi:MAG: hypothetical protein M0D55_10520 [Elusimicrobiota bacterium]|nr:MAG: hypothetical protein M0D55_10520 [Elusimicrobiota bacterium]